MVINSIRLDCLIKVIYGKIIQKSNTRLLKKQQTPFSRARSAKAKCGRAVPSARTEMFIDIRL